MSMDERSVKRITKIVNRAITDEWFAIYQYWIGSVILAENYPDVISQFSEHLQDELKHATELAGWLRQFPRVEHLPYALSELPKNQYCGYIFPSGNVAVALVNDAIDGERCAIEFYETTLDIIDRQLPGEVSELRAILSRILDKEKEHLKDLQTLIKYNFEYKFFFT